jgi:hypothetical protein
MKQLTIAIMIFLLANCSLAQRLPDSPKSWRLTVWASPPEAGTILFVWLNSDGKLRITRKAGEEKHIEWETHLDQKDLDEVYAKAKTAITSFVLDDTEMKSNAELAEGADKTWNVGLELRIGTTQIQVDDLVISDLKERPSLKALLLSINSKLPKQYQLKTKSQPADAP